MIELVISGGQTGADQAGWRAAKSAGIETGGWMPKGFLTEDGPRPEFKELYGAFQHERCDYPSRTKENVQDSHGTIWFGKTSSSGYACTHKAIRQYRTSRPMFVAFDGANESPKQDLIHWIRWHDIKIVNIAGNRESSSPGIGAWVERYLAEVFRIVKGDAS